ncbi:hypothetical protein TEA_019742 [Camellia sinensis var. sinensis]|uniref:SET domain-containing protein n=1 Tax=Camellia sinensis var. sinensis TaxID=542762 RepID=A0A4S4ERX8_CAMSN|nr:hypothetical protein TEA_019742 [Camellia sinensis var. sinensis]
MSVVLLASALLHATIESASMASKFSLKSSKQSQGVGVRSLTSIPSGSFICEYIGELLEDAEAEKDTMMTECANVGRFVNHSYSPNLYAQNVLYDHEDKKMPRIMFFAAENIPPLQELTYHYNYSVDEICDSNDNIKKKNCYCGSEECTGRMQLSRITFLFMFKVIVKSDICFHIRDLIHMQSLILMKADKENDGKVWIIFRGAGISNISFDNVFLNLFVGQHILWLDMECLGTLWLLPSSVGQITTPTMK